MEETTLSADLDSYRHSFNQLDALEGAVIIEADSQPQVRFEDEIVPAIQNLCFTPIPQLIAEEHAVVRYFSYYGYLRLDPEGDEALISGDFVPDARVSRVALAQDLYACGQRFLALVRWVYGSQPNFESDIHHVLEQARIAREVLEKHNLIPNP